MKSITQLEWRELLANDTCAVIIDSRSPSEWADGILENAVLMDVLNPPSFMKEIEKLDKNKNYYVYCRSGNRSIQACLILESKGINTTYNLLEGIIEWEGEIVSPSE